MVQWAGVFGTGLLKANPQTSFPATETTSLRTGLAWVARSPGIRGEARSPFFISQVVDMEGGLWHLSGGWQGQGNSTLGCLNAGETGWPTTPAPLDEGSEDADGPGGGSFWNLLQIPELALLGQAVGLWPW